MRALAAVVLALMCWLCPGIAQAKDTGPNGCNYGDNCTEAEAWSSCQAFVSQAGGNRHCHAAVVISPSEGRVYWSSNGVDYFGFKVYNPSLQSCPQGHEIDQTTGQCVPLNRCGDAPPSVTDPSKEGWVSCQSYSGPNGSYSCETVGIRQLGNQPYAGYVAWNATGDQCTPSDYSCPADFIKRPDGTCEPVPECPEGVPRSADGECVQPAECPTGMTKDVTGTCVPEENLCPAGQIKGPDGSCVEDSGQCGAGKVKGDDGSCKPDTNGDGEPDEPEEGEEGEHKAEDSARCDQPPTCSGDEIMCLHAKQLWRIDCNTRRARQVDMDNYCKRPPVCNSVALGDDSRNTACDGVEEAALQLQWKNACQTEAMLKLMQEQNGGETGGGDSGTHQRLDKLQQWLDGTGKEPLGTPEVPVEEAPIESQEWSSGLSGSGSCPAPESVPISLMGFSTTIYFTFDVICQFATYLYWVWIAMGGLMSAFIIAGVRK